ncbi:MAG TPA: HK97 family phage prohead protease [Mycobacterium sp.]|nr:HK97 family phage prohead protease [Mycobacterium sp.]
MADRPYETRTVTANLELRDEDSAPVLTGYASTFNDPYQVGFFRERIHPDAFKRTLSGAPDVRLLVDHEGQPLARTKSGTLELRTDAKGLSVRATLDPSDPDVQRLLPKMRRGDLDQMSFAFRVPAGGEEWDYSGDMPDRTIREANLSGGDVSVVTYPANENATAQLRARDERESAYVLAEAMLREVRSGVEFDAANIDRLKAALDALGVNLTTRTATTETAPTETETRTTLTKEAAEAIRLAGELRRSAA